jgi:hypothetical protein
MNPRPVMLGYIREELVLDLAATERQLKNFADGEGFCLDRVYHDLEQATGALWVLADELERSECRHVVVPRWVHVEAAPGRVLQQRLQQLVPGVKVWSLDCREGVIVLGTESRHRRACIGGVLVLGAFRCRAAETAVPIARLHVHESLTRAGLREMVTLVDIVLGALVDEAVDAGRRLTGSEYPLYTQTAAALHQLETEAFNELFVRLLLITRSDELVVEVCESRAHERDRIPAPLALAGRAGRVQADGGGTRTWCALPLAAAWTEMAGLVRAHHDIAAGGAW